MTTHQVRFHYGPTPDDPEPGKMWHIDCGGEVMFIAGGAICGKCGEQDDCDDAEDTDG